MSLSQIYSSFGINMFPSWEQVEHDFISCPRLVLNIPPECGSTTLSLALMKFYACEVPKSTVTYVTVDEEHASMAGSLYCGRAKLSVVDVLNFFDSGAAFHFRSRKSEDIPESSLFVLDCPEKIRSSKHLECARWIENNILRRLKIRGKVVVVQPRLHAGDVTDFLRTKGFVVRKFPVRDSAGNSAFPTRYHPRRIKELERSADSRGFGAIYLQEPL